MGASGSPAFADGSLKKIKMIVKKKKMLLSSLIWLPRRIKFDNNNYSYICVSNFMRVNLIELSLSKLCQDLAAESPGKYTGYYVIDVT